MAVGYSGGNPPRYGCYQQAATYAGPSCQHVAARALDEPVAQLVLQALHPLAIEVSLQAAEDLEAENARLQQLQHQKREQAQYEVDRALRQYDAVEPENRLLARTLERRVEEALAAQQEVEEAYRRFLVQQRRTLSAEERETIRSLSKDLPSLWNASSTTIEDRMAIVRMLVERIEVEVLDDSERVQLRVQWAGGRQTQTEVVRPVARFEQLSYYEALVERLASLRSEGHSSEQIAEQLNADGFRPPKRKQTFNEGMVRMLASRLGLTQPTPRQPPAAPVAHEHEWTIAALAAELQMPSITLDSWRRRGWVRARKSDARWLLWADEAELTRLRVLRVAPKGGWARRGLDPALTTPR
jgi:hypothetical protein